MQAAQHLNEFDTLVIFIVPAMLNGGLEKESLKGSEDFLIIYRMTLT